MQPLTGMQPISWFMSSLNLRSMKPNDYVTKFWRYHDLRSTINLTCFPVLQRTGYTIKGVTQNFCLSTLRKEWSFSMRLWLPHRINPRQISSSKIFLVLPSINEDKLTCSCLIFFPPDAFPNECIRDHNSQLHKNEWPLQHPSKSEQESTGWLCMTQFDEVAYLKL